MSITQGHSSTPRLTIEMIPSSMWYHNVRQAVTQNSWDKLRKMTYAKAGQVCEVCSGVGKQHPVECHEIWYFDDYQKIQTLLGLTALCPDCHAVKHIGLSNVQGRLQPCLEHLANTNLWTIKQAAEYANECADLCQSRSRFNWLVDITWLDQHQVKYTHKYLNCLSDLEPGGPKRNFVQRLQQTFSFNPHKPIKTQE